MFDIVDAIAHRTPVLIEYDNVRNPRRRFYTVEVHGVWETLGQFYCRGNRTAVGTGADDMEQTAPEIRNFRLSRIVSVEALEPTGYTPEPITVRSFDPVTATVYLAPGAGDHLRARGKPVGTDDNGWDGYRFEETDWPRMLDALNILGVESRTDVADYRERLRHIADLGQ
nr:WYL domain-containing protein [Flaviflexus huanghaiensis]